MDTSITDLYYLKLLSRQYPSIRAVSTGIISREAVLELPKGTEHFISDVHGEYESFRHVLKNGSGTINLDGTEYTLNDTNFPTIDPNNPCRLSEEEEEVMSLLQASFSHSEKLQKHTRFLFARGSIYLVRNSNLLYHGCIPTNSDGAFKDVEFGGGKYHSRSLMDYLEQSAREGYFGGRDTEEKSHGEDIMWYLWSGSDSPLFGKKKMATFERHFIDDKNTHRESKNPYYKYRDNESFCNRILREFGLNPKRSHIINGHVPVEVKKGESPIKANGKLLVIDGGFARAYQKKTGIAGYTLIYNPRGLLLAYREGRIAVNE